jgi:hypothetical protein
VNGILLDWRRQLNGSAPAVAAPREASTVASP